MWERRAHVKEVKDGDTLRVIIDQGFGDTKTLDLRLYDTWAPEKSEPGGSETRGFVAEWLNQNDPDGVDWPYVVTFKRVRADTHEVVTLGRYVGQLTNPQGDSLNAAVNAFVASHGYSQGIGRR
ncbi:hypothetical protein [Streptomyces sp. NPDC001297]|uniref:hypothetical protein n=1 Tax=Streptomyces sp. NPDC001297 TaxID=3364559 RepID=UPI0036B61B87